MEFLFQNLEKTLDELNTKASLQLLNMPAWYHKNQSTLKTNIKNKRRNSEQLFLNVYLVLCFPKQKFPKLLNKKKTPKLPKQKE